MNPFDSDATQMDVSGSAATESLNGYRYYVHFLDDYSRYVWLYPLKLKSDTLAAFQHFLALARSQFNATIKCLQFENGCEYKRVHDLCLSLGIHSRMSCLYTSAQNGRGE